MTMYSNRFPLTETLSPFRERVRSARVRFREMAVRPGDCYASFTSEAAPHRATVNLYGAHRDDSAELHRI